MHYYQFNIGDYRRQTAHLSLIEHGIYRALLDTYYLDEKPLCADHAKLMRSHCVRTEEEQKAFNNVLSDFFSLKEDGYHHTKCEEVIAKYHAKSEKARKSANKRWKDANASKKDANASESNANALPSHSGRTANALQLDSERNANALKNDANAMLTECELDANQKPITNNQEPITKEKTSLFELEENEFKPEPEKKPSKLQIQVDQIFMGWCRIMGKSPNQTKLTPKRDKAIRARLKDGYSTDEIIKAIEGCRADPFSMGANGRQKAFNDIELICRSGEKLEGFRDAPRASERIQTNQRSVADAMRDIGNTDW